jgi:hypothetical protein
MSPKNVKTVRNRALRVARLCKQLAAEQPDAQFSYVGSRLSGELRRASLDLTRALADMRKGS